MKNGKPMAEPVAIRLVKERGARWQGNLAHWRQHVHQPPIIVEGKLVRATGLTLEAIGCKAAVGARCLVEGEDGKRIETEVVGFGNDRLFLMPTGALGGVMPNSRVIPTRSVARIPVGAGLLGRVIDAAGEPLDNAGPLRYRQTASLHSEAINPLDRQRIVRPLDVGVRSINALLTAGRGQRLGLFAGSGVGKSTLLGMMTRYTDADVIVVGLIGERGREVREFVEDNLGSDGLSRAVVVATPSDCSPLMRLHGAWVATSIAEHFRDSGRHVLFLMDSLTRFAQAQREIGLAIGEPPATKGYPPSVFALLPQLIERTGNGRADQGSITAFYTVLAEGDYENDPIVDAARATLDGHIMLSREIAESGIYPPVDIESSVSRSMQKIVAAPHLAAAQRVRELYAYYMRHRDLITVGAYNPGADEFLDLAVRLWPQMASFLGQRTDEAVDLATSVEQLESLAAQIETRDRVEGEPESPPEGTR